MSSPSSTTGTSPPAPPTTSPAPSPPPTDPANATLYLYTFLATLVLLLAVSSAIVVRSLILRRRHQHLVEEAIRTGTWMPHRYNSTSGRRRRDFGQKPTLSEAWVNLGDNGATQENGKRNWSDMMPFYAAYIRPPTPPPQESAVSSAEDPVEPSSRSARFMRPFTRKRSPPSPQPASLSPMTGQAQSSPTSSPPSAPMPVLRVAVLIAMPDASPKHQHGDERGPPVVEIGVIEVNVEGDEIETPSPDSS